MTKKKIKANKKEDKEGVFLFAGLFVGLGLGAIYNMYLAGALIGLGVGFFAVGIAKLLKNKR